MSATSDQILKTLGPRAAIAQAVDILMATHAITEDAALDMLVQVSCDADAKVRETAGPHRCRCGRTVDPRSTFHHPRVARADQLAVTPRPLPAAASDAARH